MVQGLTPGCFMLDPLRVHQCKLVTYVRSNSSLIPTLSHPQHYLQCESVKSWPGAGEPGNEAGNEAGNEGWERGWE